MSVRKRKWTTRAGQGREAWIVDYVDQAGERHFERCERKKDADSRHAEIRVDVQAGIHVPRSQSVTVAEAGEDWIKAAERGEGRHEPLERATIQGYREILDRHIAPFIGKLKLSEINAPAVRSFENMLHAAGRSKLTIRPAVRCLTSHIACAS